MIPFPGDLLVGSYYPWLDSKWGYVVGVPVKNPLISDVFSQIYLWKEMVVNSFKLGDWPLWNPTMYSGYPLMANFQSGILNPFNIFLWLLGMAKGWGVLLWLQVVGSAITMWLLLTHYKYSKAACLSGAVVYSLAGFPIVWMEYATVGQAMIWIPLIIYVIESDKFQWMPILFLFIVGAGHFQALVYAAIIAVTYFFYKYKGSLKKHLRSFLTASIFSLLLPMVQLLPMMEFASLGIRFSENYISSFNYGLAPIKQIFSLIAPDFFGSPITNNYWGAFNYENVIYYAGILAMIGLVAAILNWKKLKLEKYYLVATILSLFFGFDTFLGRSIYVLHIPGLSTSVAGRVGVVFTLGIAVLTAWFVNSLNTMNWKRLFMAWGVIFLTAITGAGLLLGSKYFWISGFVSDVRSADVGLRNILIPLLITIILGILFIFKKHKWTVWLVLVITVGELLRFGWKYTTFSPQNMIYPPMEMTNFISSDSNTFRIDRENGEIMPPNTWSAYGWQSPSGYDPMSVMGYVQQYNKDLNGLEIDDVSRYSELGTYNAKSLGKYNVKYLLALKRDENNNIPGNILNKKIDQNEWSKVFETKSMAVLKNNEYLERARITDNVGNEVGGKAEITSYQNDKVIIYFENIDGEKLLLADTYYPGWKATLNGQPTKIGDEIKPFRTIDIKGVKKGEILFEYNPLSFRLGLAISGISFVCWLVWLVTLRKH